jgi:O-antigen ligase
MSPLLERLGGFLPAAIALLLPIVFLPVAVDSFILPRASLVIIGACLGAGLAVLVPGGPGLGRLRWPLLAAAGATILAFVFAVSWPLALAGSYTRYESLPIRIAYLGLLAAPVWLIRDQRSRNWVIAAFVFGTAIASLEAIWQWADRAPFRPDGNLGNANLLGALIAMAMPLAVIHGLRRGRFAPAWWVAVWVMEAGLLVTTSRSGMLGALAGCVALVPFALRGRAATRAAVASAAVIVAGLLVLVLSPLRLLNDDPARLRLQLWPDALHMVFARPLFGWGEDATGLVFGRFLSADWVPGVTFDRAHSGPLDIAATEGLVGLAALTLVLVIFFRGAWANRFARNVGPLAAACIGYSVWVLFNFDWAPATGAFWLLAGTAWSGIRAAQTVDGEAVASINGPAVPVALRSLAAVVLAAAAVWLAVLPVLADAWFYKGRLDLAVVVDPVQARYHRVLGEGLVGEGSLPKGVSELRTAAQLGETDPALYVELGDAERRLGESAQAISDYRRALEIDPYFAPAQQRLATG